MHHFLRRVLSLFLVVLLVPTNLFGEDDKVPPGRTIYKGRRIAQTMSYLGANWLIRVERQ